MSTLRKICLFFVLFGIGQTRACSTSSIYYPGDNANVSIDAVQIDKKNMLEIYFCGSTSKLHFSNVMVYDTNKSTDNNGSATINYSGRIKNIKMTNVSISFLLLNVTFRDSGNFTDSRNSCEKAKSTIIVARRRLTAYLDETFSLDFMYNNTHSSLVRITYIGLNGCRPLVTYNIAQKNCTYVGDDNPDLGKNCEFKDATLRLIFPSVQWQNKVVYIAWDDTGLLLDSIFMDVKEKRENMPSATMKDNVHYGNRESTTGSPLGYNVHYDWLLPSLIVMIVVVVLVAAGTASIAFRKHRQRKAILYGNGSQAINIQSRSLNAIMSSTTNSSFNNETDPMTTNCADKVKTKERQIYPREVQCVQSSTLPTSKCRTPCSLPLCENAGSQNINEYEHVYEYALLHDEYRTDETYFRLASDSLGANPTLNNMGHDAKVQHNYMTLQQIAPDPTVKTKPKKLVSVADSSHWNDKVYTKSLPKLYSSNVYNKVRKEKIEEIRFRGSNAGLQIDEVINEYVHARSLALEDSVASDATHSTKEDLTIAESSKDLILKSSLPVCDRPNATI